MVTEEDTLTDSGLDPEGGNAEGNPKKKLELDVKVDSPSACQRHVTVTISQDDVNRYFDEAISEMMPTATVPGFRPGRAPRKLVESRFRKDVFEQVKGSLLMDTMSQVSEELEFSAISEPDLDYGAVEVPDEGPMTFEFDIEVRPEFDLPKWKGLKLNKPVRKLTKKVIDQHIEKLLNREGHLVPHDGAASGGDYVVVNMTFKKDGQVISKSEENTIRILPQLSFQDCMIEGFDELMKGAKAGQTKSTEVTLSSDVSNEDLRGQSVEAAFDVLGVKKLELPELDEERLERLGNFSSEEDFREAVKTELNRQMTYHQDREIRRQITGTLTESADWDLPPDMLRRQSARELERAVMELRSSGFDEKSIQAYENNLRQNAMQSTATALKEHFILERIAEEEGIESNEADIDAEIKLIAASQDESPRRIRAQLEKRGAMDVLQNQVVERKVIREIQSNAEFKEVKFEGSKDDVEAVNLAIAGDRDDSQIPEAKHSPDASDMRQPTDHT